MDVAIRKPILVGFRIPFDAKREREDRATRQPHLMPSILNSTQQRVCKGLRKERTDYTLKVHYVYTLED